MAGTRILLVADGRSYQMGAFFRRALEELGCDYRFVDESHWLEPGPRWRLIHRVVFRLLGRRPPGYWRFNHHILKTALCFRPQAMLVIKGAYLSPRILGQVRARTGAVLINYATDDPFNRVNSTRAIMESLPLFDIYATPRQANIFDLRRAGCRQVLFLPFGYDPAVHFPERLADSNEQRCWASDVTFAGGADSDREPFLRALATEPALSLALYGGYWNRIPGLKAYWRGFAYERDYRLALAASKIALCLVRRANRDGHVMRTFELPACAAFMLAERTEEHLELFEEGQEMACFETVQELVDKARYYLAHESERQQIAASGYRRVTSAPYTYRHRVAELLSAAHLI
jgi:spore maturation protein CgeB